MSTFNLSSINIRAVFQNGLRCMKYFYLAASAILLSACGGSSDSSSGPTTSEVKLEVVQNTYCGGVVPATNAELVIYDNNWQITHRFKPDSSGKIAGTIPPASHANVSFIEQTSDENGRRVAVNSFASYPMGDLGRYTVSTEVQGDCECAQTDINVNLPASSSWQTIEVIGAAAEVEHTYSNRATIENVRICRVPTSPWPELIIKTRHSYNADLYYTLLSDYNPADTISVDLIDQAEYRSVNISPFYQQAYLWQTFSGGRSFDFLADFSQYPSLVNISSLEGIFLMASTEREVEIDGISVKQSVWVRKKVDPASNQTPELAMVDSNPATSLADVFVSLAQDDNYHYKVHNPGSYSIFAADMWSILSDGTIYEESFTGPLEGRVPEQALPSDYGLDQFIENVDQFTAYVSLLSYPQLSNYGAFAEANIERSKLTENEFLDGKWSEYWSLTLEISN